MTLAKKYYTIGEVAEYLRTTVQDLRSLDHLLKKKLLRIRGRRYYQKRDIEYLKRILGDNCAKIKISETYGAQLEFCFNANSNNLQNNPSEGGDDSTISRNAYTNRIDKLIKLMIEAKQELVAVVHEI